MTFQTRIHEGQPLETKAEADDQGEGTGDIAATVTAALEGIRTDIGARLEKLETKAADTDKRLSRPAIVTVPAVAPEPIERKAFAGFVRHGVERLQADEIKALVKADDSKGGFLAPGEFTTELLRDLVQFSPVRAAARVGSMSVGEIKIPRRTARITAKWVSEIEERPRTEPAYGMTELTAHEMSCYVDVSNQLLEDAAINIEAELAFDFAEEFGRLEGTAFVSGDGVKKPVGLLMDPAVPTVESGDADEITPDALIRVLYDLPPAYRNNGSWLLNGTSIAAIRFMKDTTGRFIWQDSLTEGQPSTLLGRPVVEAIDMPDVATGNTPVLYGDIASAYRIYDRVGLSVLRNPYTLDIYGQTRFTARRRVAAAVVRPEAVRKLQIAA